MTSHPDAADSSPPAANNRQIDEQVKQEFMKAISSYACTFYTDISKNCVLILFIFMFIFVQIVLILEQNTKIHVNIRPL